jgi:subtilisin-like proprotein convertase family protein
MKLTHLSALLSLSLGTASAATFSFSNNTVKNIPDGDSSGVASSIVVNTGIQDFLIDAQVTLDISATNGGTAYTGDMYAYLTNGTKTVMLLNRPGRRSLELAGYDDNQPMLVTFTSTATNNIHNYRIPLTGSNTTPAAAPITGVWLPDGRTTDPANVLDTDVVTTGLNSLNGSIAGTWYLFVADLSSGGTHQLNSWTLTLNAVPEPSVNLLGLVAGAGMLLLRRRKTE